MKRRWTRVILCVAAIVSLTSCSEQPPKEEPQPVTAVLGAFYREIALLKDRMATPQERTVEGIRFVRGTLGGREVAIAWTGTGKVNAGVTTALMIEHFKPAHVLFTGIAGAVDPNLGPGDIVIAERTAHHDMGLIWAEGFQRSGVKNPFTGDENPIFFEADPALLATAGKAAGDVELAPIETAEGQRPPRIVTGVIVTGDTFVASRAKCEELAEALDADAVEMEGAAVAQVCFQQDVGCLVIRSMSDKADEDAIADKQTFYNLAAENSVTLVLKIIEHLGSQADTAEKALAPVGGDR
jgi:adenosylhomocysteine nucleosidase